MEMIEFEDVEVLNYLKSNSPWVENFEEYIKCLRNVPYPSHLRINTLKYTFDDCSKYLIEFFKKHYPDYKIQIQLVPNFDDVIEIFISDENKFTNNDLTKITKFLIVDSICAASILRGSNIFSAGIMASHKFYKGEVLQIFSTDKVKYKRGSVLENGFKIDNNYKYIGIGKAIEDRKILIKTQQGPGIQMLNIAFKNAFPFDFEILDKQMFYPQNLPSCLAAYYLDPKPSDLILDMCAAPGGKTTHIAQRCKDLATIIALDHSQNRLKNIVKTCNLLGIKNVHPFFMDSLKLIEQKPLLKNERISVQIKENLFDKILLDGPCSCMGIKPLVGRIGLDYKELINHHNILKHLLSIASSLIKQNGIIVFSTCTITKIENEDIIDFAHKNLNLKNVSPPFVLSNTINNELGQRIDIRSNYNGFFISILKKVS